MPYPPTPLADQTRVTKAMRPDNGFVACEPCTVGILKPISYQYFKSLTHYLSVGGVVRAEREAVGSAIGCEAGVSVPGSATR